MRNPIADGLVVLKIVLLTVECCVLVPVIPPEIKFTFFFFSDDTLVTQLKLVKQELCCGSIFAMSQVCVMLVSKQ
jgi:hypothetical protein